MAALKILNLQNTKIEMAASIINRLSFAIQNAERTFMFTFFGRHFPPPEAFCIAASQEVINHQKGAGKPFSLKDIIGDEIFYAVPKFRRTVERRWKRKYGVPKYVWKPLVTKDNLRSCPGCGHHHEVGVICAHCYEKIRLETKEMQDAIQKELGLKPVEEDVVVLYEGEKLDKPEEFWKGKRVVEMAKARPAWFSKNLLQRTTQQPATSTDVKPTGLA